MKKQLTILLAIIFLIIPSSVMALSGRSYSDTYGNTYYHFNDGTSGHSYSDGYGNTYYYIDIPSDKPKIHTGCSDLALSKCDEIKKEKTFWNKFYHTIFGNDDESIREEVKSRGLKTKDEISKMSDEDQRLIRTKYYIMAEVELDILRDETEYWDCNFCWLNIFLKPDCSLYPNSYLKDDNCVCEDGYVVYNNECVSYYDYCYNKYGSNVIGDKDEIGVYCYCADGYDWNADQTCVPKQKILGAQIDMNLSNRLKGKLLLQVEDRGRIWYVNPDDGQKFEVTFVNALPLFENFALGITDKDLNSIPQNNEVWTSAIGNRLKGKLLLQVEDKGRIWYVDFNGKRWEVTWANLMNLFQSLALGITNADLSKIPTGNLQ